MIQITSAGISKQVLRLSTGEYTLKPGKVLTLKKYSEQDVKFLHSLGFRITNMDSQSTMVKEIRKPAPLPKGVTLVEKKPKPDFSRSVISSTELREARQEPPEEVVIKQVPKSEVKVGKIPPKPVELDQKVSGSIEKTEKKGEEIQEAPFELGQKASGSAVEPEKEVKEVPEAKEDPPKFGAMKMKESPSPVMEKVSTKELKMRKPRKKRSIGGGKPKN